jgi:pheromone shutdown-related protein TraB
LENSDKTNESTAPLCLGVDPSAIPSQPEKGAQAHEVVIVGTAHVSEKSVQEVTKAIEEMKPDIVAVELCPARYRALTGQEEEQEIKISEILSGGKIYYILVQWFLAYIQKRIGKEMGVKPGAEMLAQSMPKTGARVALVDRDVGLPFKLLVGHGICGQDQAILPDPAAFGWGEEELDIDSITKDDIVSQMISEFRKVSPSAANVLVDERDAYIAQNLVNLSKHGRVLAVVGAGHKEGISRHLAHPESIPAIEKLKEKPQKKITFAKVFGAAVTLLILGTIGLVLINAQSSQSILLAFGIWFLVTGG